MCDTPVRTTSWSPAVKWNGSKKLTYGGGAEGVTSQISFLSSHLINVLWPVGLEKNKQTNILYNFQPLKCFYFVIFAMFYAWRYRAISQYFKHISYFQLDRLYIYIYI